MSKNYGTEKEQRLCEVCGARLSWYIARTTTTCDHTCTKAKHRGTSREIEVERETMRAGDFGAMAMEDEIGIMKGKSKNFVQQSLCS